MQTGLSLTQKILKFLLGAFLFTAGLSHLTWRRTEFLAQVPPWVPMNPDTVVIWSGVVEMILGLGLILLWQQRGALIGLATAIFFVLIFPGNISQYVNQISAFGLDTDRARLIRLFFQPVLVAWALWSTGAWVLLREWRQKQRRQA